MSNEQGGTSFGKILAWVLGILFLLGLLCCGGFWMVGKSLVKRAEDLQREIEASQIAVQGSGNEITQTRTLEGFSHIDAEGAVTVMVQFGDAQSVAVTGDDNIVPLITTDVRNGTLEIDSDGSYSNNLPITVSITLPALDSITMDGACRMDVSAFVGAQLVVDLEGATNLTVRGVVDDLTVNMDNAARADLARLKAKRVMVDVEGAANLDVYADEKLDISADNAARVEYAGKAQPTIKQSRATNVYRKE